MHTPTKSVLTLTSFPFRVIFANELYATMTNRRNILGESVFDLIEREGRGTRNQTASPTSSLSSTSSLRHVGPSIVSCANGPFSGGPDGKEEIVLLRCAASGKKTKSKHNSGGSRSTVSSDKASLRNKGSGLFCRIRVRPVYKLPIKRRKINDPNKHKVLQYYAVFLDKVDLQPGSPSFVNVPLQLGSIRPNSSESTF